MLHDKVYIQIFADRMLLRSVVTGRELELRPSAPYSHPRAIIGNFTIAEETLRKGIKDLQRGRFILRTLAVIHPRERIEGGITQVEETCLREVGIGARANKVIVWSGTTLTDAEVEAKLR